MYITQTTDNVKKIFEELESKTDEQKLKFLIYVFGLLNNNQINDKNESNPDLVENDDMNIFTFESIGITNGVCMHLLEYFTMLYNKLTNTKDAYIDNENVLGIKSDEEDKKFESHFGKLNFNEKLDVFSELVIRCDNDTYLSTKLFLNTYLELDGFDIAKQIQNLKINTI